MLTQESNSVQIHGIIARTYQYTRIFTNGSTRISTGSSYARFQQSSSRTRFESQAGCSSKEIGVFTKNFGDSQGSSRRKPNKEVTNSSDSKAAQDKCCAISKWIEEIHNGNNPFIPSS